jgi:hypothetical protein
VKETRRGGKCMKEFMEAKPIYGEVWFSHSINNSTRGIANASGKNEKTYCYAAFLPKLRKINNGGPTKTNICDDI